MDTNLPVHTQIINATRQELKEVKPDDREQVLLQLADSPVWKVLKEFMENKVKRINELAGESADGSANLEEIGLRFLMARVVGGVCADLINEVEGMAQARYDTTQDQS